MKRARLEPPRRLRELHAKIGEPEAYASLLYQYIQTDDPSDCQIDYRAQVSPPWYVNFVGSDYDLCPWEKDMKNSCFLSTCGGDSNWKVYTTDPAAPARNVIFERVPNPGSCP